MLLGLTRQRVNLAVLVKNRPVVLDAGKVSRLELDQVEIVADHIDALHISEAT